MARFLERNPPDPFEFMIVKREVSANGFHQPVVHGLTYPDTILNEYVGNRRERFQDPDLEARLFLNLAKGRLLDRLVLIGRSLGQGPGAPSVITVAATQADDEREVPVHAAEDDPSGGSGGR